MVKHNKQITKWTNKEIEKLNRNLNTNNEQLERLDAKIAAFEESSKELERIAFEKTLKYDEHIACTNATVIVNDKGEITGWVDNNEPIQFICKD